MVVAATKAPEYHRFTLVVGDSARSDLILPHCTLSSILIIAFDALNSSAHLTYRLQLGYF